MTAGKKSNNDVLQALEKAGIQGVKLEADGADLIIRIDNSFQEFLEFKELIKTHNEIDTRTMKLNIRRVLKESKLKNTQLSTLLDCSVHTAYSYTNPANKGRPDFLNLILLSKYIGIDMKEFYQ